MIKFRMIKTAFCTPVALILLLTSSAYSAGEVLKDVVYKKVAQKELHLDILYPEQPVEGGYPIVVHTHGGGWAAGNKASLHRGLKNDVAEGLLANGFCIVSVQYRLYRKGGTVAIRDCVTDAKDAIRFMAKHREKYQVNTDRVYTFGDSAGGQLCQMLLLSGADQHLGAEELREERYQMVAGVSWYGPSDFEDMQLFNHDGREDFRDRFGPRIMRPTDPAADKLKLYRDMSPVNYLSAESAPLLMIQGDGDTTIPVAHAYHMKERAEAVKAPVKTLIVKHAGHNWRKADGKTEISPSKEVIARETIQFLTKHQ